MVYLDSGNVYTSSFLGVNETAKIGVAGDSAGGMISASISHTIKGIDFQV
jgi:acetyl esterase/lipase